MIRGVVFAAGVLAWLYGSATGTSLVLGNFSGFELFAMSAGGVIALSSLHAIYVYVSDEPEKTIGIVFFGLLVFGGLLLYDYVANLPPAPPPPPVPVSAAPEESGGSVFWGIVSTIFWLWVIGAILGKLGSSSSPSQTQRDTPSGSRLAYPSR